MYVVSSTSIRKQLAIVIHNKQKDVPYKNAVYAEGSIGLFMSAGMVFNRIGEGDGAARSWEAITSNPYHS